MKSWYFKSKKSLKFSLPVFFLWVWTAMLPYIWCSCSDNSTPGSANPGVENPTRAASIADTAVKMTPETDFWPPVVHNTLWAQPLPMAGPINTAGVEDAPVISSDGNTLLFFFTPDGNLPAEQQLLDNVTGIWWCTKEGSGWTEPVRAYLAGEGEDHLDGPFALVGDTLWFGSIRAGNYGLIDIYTAQFSGQDWANWQNAGLQINQDFDAGELYLTADGKTLVFGSTENGYGQTDLWMSSLDGQQWSDPVNMGTSINSVEDESRPVISSDGSELWFTRMISGKGYPGPAIFRSTKTNQGWSEAEEIVSGYAGDPGLDDAGNLYFTHLFYDNAGNKIEADIYVAYRH